MNKDIIALELTLMAMADKGLTVNTTTHSFREQEDINRAYAKEVYTFFNEVYAHIDIPDRDVSLPVDTDLPEPMITFDLRHNEPVEIELEEEEIIDLEPELKKKVKYQPMKPMSARDILSKTDTDKENINLEDSVIELDKVDDKEIIPQDEDIMAKFNLRSDYK